MAGICPSAINEANLLGESPVLMSFSNVFLQLDEETVSRLTWYEVSAKTWNIIHTKTPSIGRTHLTTVIFKIIINQKTGKSST